MKMSTMSLYEYGDSTGQVSLSDMFDEKESSGRSLLSIEDIGAEGQEVRNDKTR